MNGNHGAGHSGLRPTRPPTVDEALQYSPLSSIVPFNADVIPFPTAVPSLPSSRILNEEERAASRKVLDILENESAQPPGTPSIQLQHTLQEFQRLLDSDDLCYLKFKAPVHAKAIATRKQPNPRTPNGSSSTPTPVPKLSQFANMVLKSTGVSFRCMCNQGPVWHPADRSADPSPISPGSQVESNHVASAKATKDATQIQISHAKARVAAANEAAHMVNLKLSAPLPQGQIIYGDSRAAAANEAAHTLDSDISVPSPHILIHSGDGAAPVVMIPGLPDFSRRDEYEAFPDVDARVTSDNHSPSKKRKRDELEEEPIAISIDQRQRTDAAVNNLQHLMAEIFAEEDQLQPDTSGAMSTDNTRFFHQPSHMDNNAFILQQDSLVRLESGIQKVVSLGRFSDISIEHLARLQKLCELAVNSVETLVLSLGDDPSEDDVEQWVFKLQAFENGLHAARTALRIATAGNDEKQLYSEEIVQSILNALRTAVDSCLISAIEARSTNMDLFKVYSSEKTHLCSLLHSTGRVFKLLGILLVKVDLSEAVITATEFLATKLVFVENAHVEKESALGIQKFESVRRAAMDVVAKVFLRHPDQRTFIFDEILTSLEKLPVTRQSARQYKRTDGKPIQLVSALVMRLIQTTALLPNHRKYSTTDHDTDRADLNSNREASRSKWPQESITGDGAEHALEPDFANTLQQLIALSKPLHDAAQSSAQYLVKYLIQRALTATKTGELPYRNLLEIFTEDFLSVLGSPDWPAAELILRVLLSNLLSLVDAEKSTVQAKNMALDFMGLMGSGISDLQIHARHTSQSLKASESEFTAQLIRLSEDLMNEKISDKEMLQFDGPYRGVLEYINMRDDDDGQLQSAYGYHITQWAKSVWTTYTAENNVENKIQQNNEKIRLLCSVLIATIKDSQWLQSEYEFEALSAVQGSLCAELIVLNAPFCKAWKRIFNVLLTSMGSSHASIKSRSLKSVIQLLEKDPSILDRGTYVINRIINCTHDGSSLVRDSALNLIGKCLNLRPSLDSEVVERIVARTADAGLWVRKRAMRILKDMYQRNEGKEMRASISEALLQRMNDTDESVCELARHTFEEIWIAPFHDARIKKDSAQYKLSLQNQVSLMVRTVQRGEAVLSVFETLIRAVLSNNSKDAAANFVVCKAMVSAMFEGIIGNESIPSGISQAQILQTLTVFAKADPRLLDAEQLEFLHPYVEHLSTTDDLIMYRAVVVIFRHVLPRLSSPQHDFLGKIQGALLSNIPKLEKMELEEVSMCLWTIDGVLKNTERLNRLMMSVLVGIHAAKNTYLHEQADRAVLSRVKRYAMIAGHFGKACDFESNIATFRAKFPWWKGDSVSGLIVDTLYPLTEGGQHPLIRRTALESIGMLCQAWPKQYLRLDVSSAFERVFIDHDDNLESILLSAFRNFFFSEEKRSESGSEIMVGEGAAKGSERLGRSLAASESDGVSTSIAQRFLKHVLRIALSVTNDLAVTAAQVIACISRQGLVHPKECGPSLVALETSLNPAISNVAFQEHRNLHHKHESMFEKEYMKAVYQAFIYQKDVVRDELGATTQPYASKLRHLFDILKSGSSKVRKRFLTNLCSRIDVDLSKAEIAQEPPLHVMFSRFCLENIAFFEYARIDEIVHLVSCMEKCVTDSGTPIAHAIETEVLGSRKDLEQTENAQLAAGADDDHHVISPQRLRYLTAAAMVLSMMWETRSYLRRQWGLQKRDGKAKLTVKDLNKAPTKVAGITGDKYWEKMMNIMKALADENMMRLQCAAFVELLSVDNELKLAMSDDDDNELEKAATGYETPSGDEANGTTVPASGGSRGRKRKNPLPAASTPSKPRKKAKNMGRKSVSSNSDGDEKWD